MKLVFQTKPEFSAQAYQMAAQFVGLRQYAEGQFRDDETLKTCLSASMDFVENETGLNFRVRDYLWEDIRSVPIKLPVGNLLPVQVLHFSSQGADLDFQDFELVEGETSWKINVPERSIVNGALELRAGFEDWTSLPDDIKMASLEFCQFHFLKSRGQNADWPLNARIVLQSYRQDLRLGFA